MAEAMIFRGILKDPSDFGKKLLFFQKEEDVFAVLVFRAQKGLETVLVKECRDGFFDLKKKELFLSWRARRQIKEPAGEYLVDISDQWEYPVCNDVFKVEKIRSGYRLLLQPEPWR